MYTECKMAALRLQLTDCKGLFLLGFAMKKKRLKLLTKAVDWNSKEGCFQQSSMGCISMSPKICSFVYFFFFDVSVSADQSSVLCCHHEILSKTGLSWFLFGYLVHTQMLHLFSVFRWLIDYYSFNINQCLPSILRVSATFTKPLQTQICSQRWLEDWSLLWGWLQQSWWQHLKPLCRPPVHLAN